ncbi:MULTISPECIES: BTAD domain-containing putative transcriptional regulator [Streptosporangium]|uniref:DNA-binding SARP family transcriptional activator n=1 Tax=Streptosporangium brasiliense TaxID=47480 RepID=A0ABT9R1Z7_9ACTN|nr:BTAD domain-containing putative transcriptional regulator [Streptosporangium brasiliense]MDP9862505.1 DNA-binding SARP family transcriptional activator [Streptosporangium brasiliense]
MDFRVLGPVGVVADDGMPLDIGPYQQRAVLAMCMLAAPRPVGPHRLIDALWEDVPPPGAVNTVQAYISKLRRVFEPGRRRDVPPAVLVSRPGGYALDIPETALDLARARERAAEGRRMSAGGEHEAAGRQFRLALEEWRGEPLADFAGAAWAAEEIAHLAEFRLALEEDLAEADLALGLGATLTGALSQLVAAHPFRERLRVLGAHALYQAGRQADALAVLAEGRRLLVEDLGLDPDPRSREMERRILDQDPALTPRVRTAARRRARLVGRDAEAEALDLAVAGEGHQVVLLAGEPGIGKTSLAEHAAETARSRGRRVVWGRCWDGSGTPPFWPWTQAVQELVGKDGELTQLAAAGQFQFYEAFARLLNEHGRLMVVLDDLQWADASSLRLLEFLASTRLCPELAVVATYRDTDVPPGGALEHALGALVRLPHVRRLLLRGLGEEEIREYLGRAGADPDRAGEMDRLTAGNPFFLGEVLQLGETPQALSDVVRGRMAGLPPDTEEVLTVAALLGRDAATDTLLRVVELPEERVLDIVDAAVRARLLIEGDGLTCRFVHDIVRDVLREGLPPLRRRRLHARIAEVVEERSGTRLTEIAHHYREGLLTPRMAGKAIGYTRRAAAQAMAQFAHEDAVENLEQAISMIDRLPRSDDALRCDLLIDLAEAQAAAGMSIAAHASLEAAAEIAEGLGDDNRLARAVLGFSDPIHLAMYEEITGIDRLVERIDRVLASGLAEGSPWRARLLAAAAMTGSAARPVERSVAMAREAVRLARRTGDDRALSNALIVLEMVLRHDHDHDGARAVIDELLEIGLRTGDLTVEWIGREAEYMELSAQGRADEAVELLSWLRETADRLRLPSMVSLTAWQSAVLAYLGGRFADALAAAEESGAAHPEGALGRGSMGRGDADLRSGVLRFLALRARGAAGEALTLADKTLAQRPGQRPWQILRCLALIDLGRADEARVVFAEISRDGFALIEPDLAYRFVPDAVSELCAALGDVAAGWALYGRLAPNAGRLLGWSVTDLCLARLALLDGDRERAGAHLRAAEDFVRRAGTEVYRPALRDLRARLPAQEAAPW